MRKVDEAGHSPLGAVTGEIRTVTSRIGLAATALALVATAVISFAAPI